ncbi:hypothetical protein SDC9_96995 [bioreactor metagenome]|uniref:Polysaccharide biosynthesis protein C-terminal domain-containing protein n=1 Tax=bioreactor metagenome TaxID=1076179 RepID=A0A645AAL3_9ZZZZ
MQLSNAIILTLKSNWKPKLYYEISILAEMLSFSIWSLIEALTIWLATWIDSFIIGSVLSQYYLGLYKTSTSLVNTLMTIITASVAPVLFSTLSRIQDDDSQFVRIYLKVQRVISIIVLPLGVGIFIYDDLVTKILLGDAWNEAGNVIGIWALTTSIMIVFEHFCSEVYRSKGKPKISILAQVLHLVVLVPACIISSKFGFWSLVYTRAWIRMEAVVIHLIIMKWMIGLNIKDNFKNVMPSLIAVLAMGLLGGYLQKMASGIWWDLLSIALCSVLYFGILLLFPSMRKEARKIINIRG